MRAWIIQISVTAGGTMTSLKTWNENKKHLQVLLRGKTDIKKTIEAISLQHRLVHVAAMAHGDVPTFEDALWARIDDTIFRRISEKSMYSVAWHLWHSARIEDISTSFFLVDEAQEWERFKDDLDVPFRDTGNCMDRQQMVSFNKGINMAALCEYRVAVGRKTQHAIQGLTFGTLGMKVSGTALDLIAKNGYVLQGASWLIDYWGKEDYRWHCAHAADKASHGTHK